MIRLAFQEDLSGGNGVDGVNGAGSDTSGYEVSMRVQARMVITNIY